jgi:hypothetical protein
MLLHDQKVKQKKGNAVDKLLAVILLEVGGGGGG